MTGTYTFPPNHSEKKTLEKENMIKPTIISRSSNFSNFLRVSLNHLKSFCTKASVLADQKGVKIIREVISKRL